MDRRFHKAVVAAFRDEDADRILGIFAAVDGREWIRGSRWLHTSGLALYVLGRMRKLGIEDVIPVEIRRGLEFNLEQNKTRTEDLFREFVRINVGLQRAKLSYANLKGFTLAPRACSDPAYRYQHDLDFLMARGDEEGCRHALEALGYRLTARCGDSWEYVSGEPEACGLADLYKVRRQRNVEVHFTGEGERSEACGAIDPLSRLQLQMWDGFEFPALAECDKLLGQAVHLFKHFQTEWTRAAWMLEYATAIRSHAGDAAFWREVTTALDRTPAIRTAVGAATLLTMSSFGAVPPSEFVAGTVEAMPEEVRRWFDCYGNDVVYVEHPGSKLYLLLQDVLFASRAEWRQQRRRRLLPSRLPPRHNTQPINADRPLAAKLAWARLRFVARRLSFHIVAGLRYKLEAARWKLHSAPGVQR